MNQWFHQTDPTTNWKLVIKTFFSDISMLLIKVRLPRSSFFGLPNVSLFLPLSSSLFLSLSLSPLLMLSQRSPLHRRSDDCDETNLSNSPDSLTKAVVWQWPKSASRYQGWGGWSEPSKFVQPADMKSSKINSSTMIRLFWWWRDLHNQNTRNPSQWWGYMLNERFIQATALSPDPRCFALQPASIDVVSVLVGSL